MLVDLILTSNCNLKCRYCFEDGNNCRVDSVGLKLDDEDMKYSIAIDAIEYFKDIAIKTNDKGLQINFFGGEPLLRFNFIKDIVKYCEENIKDIYYSFTMTTNATLFDEKVYNYCIEHNFYIMFSIDGNEVSHNKNRICQNSNGSFYLIKNNFEFIRKFINFSKGTQIKYILNPNNIKYFCDSMIYLSQFNTSISFEFNYEEIWSQENIDVFQKEFDKYLKFYKKKRESVEFKSNNIEIDNILKSLNKNNIFSYCGAGESRFTVKYNGDIYPCARFVIPNIDKLGGVYESHNELNNNEEKCSEECVINEFCNCQCKFINKLYTGKLNKPPKIFCDIQKIMFYYVTKNIL